MSLPGYLPATGALILLLASCASISLDRPPSHYRVKKGDTLQAIAFRYGLDYMQVAKANGIGPPYTIYPAQRLKLIAGPRQPAEKDAAPETTTSKPALQTRAQKEIEKKIEKLPAGKPGFRWPVKGRVVRGFSLGKPLNKGIDILARAGERVKAAADGVVVYTGRNISGYGSLVILKHNEHFLSAYGNLARMQVKEGDQIRSGISIGVLGVDSPLHFEIRRDGKPQNPLDHLPAG